MHRQRRTRKDDDDVEKITAFVHIAIRISLVFFIFMQSDRTTTTVCGVLKDSRRLVVALNSQAVTRSTKKTRIIKIRQQRRVDRFTVISLICSCSRAQNFFLVPVEPPICGDSTINKNMSERSPEKSLMENNLSDFGFWLSFPFRVAWYFFFCVCLFRCALMMKNIKFKSVLTYFSLLCFLCRLLGTFSSECLQMVTMQHASFLYRQRWVGHMIIQGLSENFQLSSQFTAPLEVCAPPSRPPLPPLPAGARFLALRWAHMSYRKRLDKEILMINSDAERTIQSLDESDEIR